MQQELKSRILTELGAKADGLTEQGVRESKKKYGENSIPEKREPLIRLLFAQFHDVMVYILLGAIAVSLAVPLLQHGSIHRDEMVNAVVIFAIVILNAILGFSQEWRAENAIALLKKLSAPQVKVRRNGTVIIIPSHELVVGDVMLVEAGDRVSADARIIESSSLEVDESSLTGESVPDAKRPVLRGEDDVSEGTIFAGTMVSRGSGEAVVVSIGIQTEIGKITSMVMHLKPPPTPLQITLQNVGKKIGVIVLILCVLFFIVGLLKGMPPVDIFFTAVSLAVAAVPEGLPAIVTICLAIGVQRMIKKNALVRRLDAIETLGNVSVICADKTGTMTENKMAVTDSWLVPGSKEEELLIAIMASCNRAILPDIGDPTEIALLDYAVKKNVEWLEIVEEEVPFTSEAKYMSTRHMLEGKSVVFYKGAPEVIVGMANQPHQTILQQNTEMSEQGLRVLAAAIDRGQGIEVVGLLAMLDPPRKDVKEAVELAKAAGIRTIMITGDNAATAGAVARKVGLKTERVITGRELEVMDIDTLKHELKSVSVFARVQPTHKVKILEALQELGEVVAMSGDGVNDAPALKRAHVGVAMGKKGTDVAREAAAMVLTDDNYATIVSAIAEGRRIYDNIKKFVVFLLRSNLGEVFIVTTSLFVGLPLPLLPLHILWINLVTDSFPALALAAEKGERGIMSRPPRRQEEGMLKGEMPMLVLAGALNAIFALIIFVLVLREYPGDLVLARSAVLTATIVYQMCLVFSTRVQGSVFKASPFGNTYVVIAVVFALAMQVVLLMTPLSGIFGVKPLPILLWEEIFGGAFVAFLVFEMLKRKPSRGS